MGILTDICMIFTLVASLQNLPLKWTFLTVAKRTTSRYALLIVMVALWNILWYAPQHFTEFWGQMGFAAGVSMLLTIMPIIEFDGLPDGLKTKQVYTVLLKFQWMQFDWKYILVRLVLFDCIVQYTWTLVVLN